MEEIIKQYLALKTGETLEVEPTAAIIEQLNIAVQDKSIKACIINGKIMKTQQVSASIFIELS